MFFFHLELHEFDKYQTLMWFIQIEIYCKYKIYILFWALNMKKLILHICKTSENIILDIVNWIKHTIKLFLFLFFFIFLTF